MRPSSSPYYQAGAIRFFIRTGAETRMRHRSKTANANGRFSRIRDDTPQSSFKEVADEHGSNQHRAAANGNGSPS